LRRHVKDTQPLIDASPTFIGDALTCELLEKDKRTVGRCKLNCIKNPILGFRVVGFRAWYQRLKLCFQILLPTSNCATTAR
jgi:hypothetical protein